MVCTVKIVKKTAREFDVPYHQHTTFFEAVKSHFTLLNGAPREREYMLEGEAIFTLSFFLSVLGRKCKAKRLPLGAQRRMSKVNTFSIFFHPFHFAQIDHLQAFIGFRHNL